MGDTYSKLAQKSAYQKEKSDCPEKKLTSTA